MSAPGPSCLKYQHFKMMVVSELSFAVHFRTENLPRLSIFLKGCFKLALYIFFLNIKHILTMNFCKPLYQKYDETDAWPRAAF